jgi:hypothetical protein
MGVVEGNVQMPLYQKPYSILKRHKMKYICDIKHISHLQIFFLYVSLHWNQVHIRWARLRDAVKLKKNEEAEE